MISRSILLCWIALLAIPQMGWAQEKQSNEPIPPNHLVPAVDILTFDFLLNRYGYHTVDRDTYDVTASSIRRNLQSPWVIDNDPFDINQFMHPYQGSMYHGFARSAGLNYWESMGYTFAGSMLWEIAGETTLPSRNDQIASGIGGSFFGEPLFRLAQLILNRPNPSFWRELSATVVSPATGFNRLAYGDRFRGTFPSHDPAVFSRVQFGAMGGVSTENGLTQPRNGEAVADFSVDYGMPGKPGYTYRRPFDYFHMQFTSSTESRFENIFTRGLLVGSAYGENDDRARGIWGLYGSYDYVAPQIFRVSSVALSLGTTVQRKVAESGAILSTFLAGVGYAAGGGLGGENESDYHYGLAPQMLAGVRIIPADRVAVDLTARDYYVSPYLSTKQGGSENIARLDALFSIRLAGRHAASVRYIWSQRATYGSDPMLGNVLQSRGSIGLCYTYLGGTRFGAVQF